MEVAVILLCIIVIGYCDIRLRLRELKAEQNRDMQYMDWYLRKLDDSKADRVDSFD